METAKLIRQIAAYVLFVIAATWFFYEMVVLSTAMYIDSGADLNAYLLGNVYKPLMYAVVCLAIMLVSQFALLGKPQGNDRYISSLLCVFLFGVGLGVSIFILIHGLLAIPSHTVCNDPSYLCFAMIPTMIICLGEFVYGLVMFLLYRKEQKKEKEIKARTKPQDERVDLTKE